MLNSNETRENLVCMSDNKLSEMNLQDPERKDTSAFFL